MSGHKGHYIKAGDLRPGDVTFLRGKVSGVQPVGDGYVLVHYQGGDNSIMPADKSIACRDKGDTRRGYVGSR